MFEYSSFDQFRVPKQKPSFGAEIMSKEKYPSIFLRQIEAVVFIILQIFFDSRTYLKIVEFLSDSFEYSPVLVWEYLVT